MKLLLADFLPYSAFVCHYASERWIHLGLNRCGRFACFSRQYSYAPGWLLYRFWTSSIVHRLRTPPRCSRHHVRPYFSSLRNGLPSHQQSCDKNTPCQYLPGGFIWNSNMYGIPLSLFRGLNVPPLYRGNLAGSHKCSDFFHDLYPRLTKTARTPGLAPYW